MFYYTPPPYCNKGFTLAETLITLVIVGVVAALTVPNLIIKHQKEETLTRLKKAYSTIAQTTNRAIADNGPVKTWEIGRDLNADDTKTFLNKYIIPYLSVKSKPTTSAEGNWDKTRYYLNGTKQDFENYYVRFYLNDGTSITAKTDNHDTKRIILEVDINGDKKPNRMGRDIFEFHYWFLCASYEELEGKLIPNGFQLNNRNKLMNESIYSCNKNGYGTRCAGLIVFDGWRIADDYPW